MSKKYSCAELSRSLLTRQESTAIKGVLILLIILGHNATFTTIFDEYRIMRYLYLFHIQTFFILPFLYDIKAPSYSGIKNSFARLYWPYIIFATVLYCIFYLFAQKNALNISDLPYLLINGEKSVIKSFCGNQLLWFMPAMFSLLILKGLFYYSNRIVKISLIVISSFIFAISILGNYENEYADLGINIERYLPVGLFGALKFLIPGILCRQIILLANNRLTITIASSILFIGLSVLFFIQVANNADYRPVAAVMPFVFVVVIYGFKDYVSRSNLLRYLGSISFQLYLFHAYIGYAIFYLVTKYSSLNIWWAILAQILMTLGATLIAIMIQRTNFIRKILFPGNWAELKSLFKINRSNG